MSHPAQSKYGACQAHQKNGKPCGLAIVRGGFCMYHQPEEQMRRALAKLEAHDRKRDAMLDEIQRIGGLKRELDPVGKTRTL